MKRSLLAFALMACASLAAACYRLVAEPVVAAYRMVRSVVFDAFKLASNESYGASKPMVKRVQAKAFTQRIEKRERPVVTSAWRMCPSI